MEPAQEGWRWLRLKQTHYSNVQSVGSVHGYKCLWFSSENPEEVLRQFVAGRGGLWLRKEDAAQQPGQVWEGTAQAMAPTTGSGGI